MFLFRLAFFLHPHLCRRVVFQCQGPVRRGVLPLCIQRAARCTATLILVLPGEPFPRLCPDLGESLTADRAFEPDSRFVERDYSTSSRSRTDLTSFIVILISMFNATMPSSVGRVPFLLWVATILSKFSRDFKPSLYQNHISFFRCGSICFTFPSPLSPIVAIVRVTGNPGIDPGSPGWLHRTAAGACRYDHTHIYGVLRS